MPEKKKPHANAFIPTQAQRDDVVKFARWGLNYEQIAGIMGISKRTVVNHFAEEVAKGKPSGISIAAGQLFRKVMEGNLTAIIFYLKTQGGFNDRSAHQFVNGNGEPIDIDVNLNLKAATDAELDILDRFLTDAIAASGQDLEDEGPGGEGGKGARSDRG